MARRAKTPKRKRAAAHSVSKLRRPRQPMPAMVRAALEERNLADAYRARPPYQRNDYLWWINSAKLEATKMKRMRQMLRELAAGHGYMGMAWRGK
jgi:uncharacterized protein YdeI (YjbR/CyaY-like superfamily)